MIRIVWRCSEASLVLGPLRLERCCSRVGFGWRGQVMLHRELGQSLFLGNIAEFLECLGVFPDALAELVEVIAFARLGLYAFRICPTISERMGSQPATFT